MSKEEALFHFHSVSIICTILTQATSSGSHADMWLSIMSFLSHLFAGGLCWDIMEFKGSE